MAASAVGNPFQKSKTKHSLKQFYNDNNWFIFVHGYPELPTGLCIRFDTFWTCLAFSYTRTLVGYLYEWPWALNVSIMIVYER